MKIDILSTQEAAKLWGSLYVMANDKRNFLIAEKAHDIMKALTENRPGRVWTAETPDVLAKHFEQRAAELDEESQQFIHKLLLPIRAETL